MEQSIELRHLRYFVAVFQHRSFTNAANELCVTQSTVSKGMRELEDRLGVPLFFRHSNRVSPTAGGVQLFECAQPLLDLYRESLEEVRQVHSRASAGLRLGCEMSADRRILAIAEKAYRRLFPASEVETLVAPADEILAQLACGSLDAAIVTLPSHEPATRVVTLGQERMVVCMRSDDELAVHSELEAYQVTGRIKIFNPPAIHRKAHLSLMKLLEEEGIAIGVPLFATSIEGRFNLVRAGLGLTMVLEHRTIPPDLTTRPFRRLKWTVDTALLYRPSLRKRATSIWAMRLERTLRKKRFCTPRPPP